MTVVQTYSSSWLAIASMALLMLLALPSHAQELESTLTCPASEDAGQSVDAMMSYENEGCGSIQVRIISTIVGNGDDTLGGLGIYGPTIAEAVVVVPAGTDRFCGCDTGNCNCSGQACTDDSDCPFCYAQEPGVANVPVEVAPPLPAALEGTVSTVILMSEYGAEKTKINQCLVEVL